MSLNKLTGQQNTGVERWMNLKANTIQATTINHIDGTATLDIVQANDITADGDLNVKCTDTNLLSYKTPTVGEEGDVLTSNGLGGVSFQPATAYSLITVPNQETSSIETLDYDSKMDKDTWTDTSLNKYNLYNYYGKAYRPSLRQPFLPVQVVTEVASEAELKEAVANQNDNIVISGSFTLASIISVSYSCKISCVDTSYTIFASGITNMFQVTADNVFFDNVTLSNLNTSSVTTCISFIGFGTNNCVHNCTFFTNEFAITSDLPQIQLYNNEFVFSLESGSPDSHRYITLSKCTGKTLIYENKFHGNGILSSQCILLTSNNGTVNFTNGHLFLYKNESRNLPVQRMAIMEIVPSNFKLTMIDNIIETYTDFFILYGDGMLDGFSDITANGNIVTLIDGSPGFKGLVGWDSPGSGGDITYCPPIRASLNTLPNTLRSDYSPLPNCTAENPILCFKNTVFTTSLEVPINPPLVAYTD